MGSEEEKGEKKKKGEKDIGDKIKDAAIWVGETAGKGAVGAGGAKAFNWTWDKFSGQDKDQHDSH